MWRQGGPVEERERWRRGWCYVPNCCIRPRKSVKFDAGNTPLRGRNNSNVLLRATCALNTWLCVSFRGQITQGGKCRSSPTPGKGFFSAGERTCTQLQGHSNTPNYSHSLFHKLSVVSALPTTANMSTYQLFTRQRQTMLTCRQLAA